jgi:threonine dehydratase
VTTHTIWHSHAVNTDRISGAIGFSDLEKASKRIAGMAIRTPVKRSFTLSERLGGPAFLKLETMQPTGAFKLRGAANHLLSLAENMGRCGVITVSTGNHGRAVAYVARELGLRCVVCLSKLVPQNKIRAIEIMGAELDIGGASQDIALQRARVRAEAEGLVMLSPFDDPLVIAGQGTIGLEILNAVPDVATVVLPLSGGGLAAGVALGVKTVRPEVRVVGVASERSPAMLRSLQAGRPIEVPEHSSLADSLGGGIGLDNQFTFQMVRELVDEIQLVSDAEIAEALRFAFYDARLILEGAAGAPIAVLLRASSGEFRSPIVAVATGDNIDPQLLLNICR